MDDSVQILLKISHRFEYFLEVLGLDPDHPVISSLETKRVVTISDTYRRYVIAWMLWNNSFTDGIASLWARKNLQDGILNNDITEVIDMFDAGIIPKHSCYHSRTYWEFANGSRLILSGATPYGGIGKTLSRAIIDGVKTDSSLFNKIMQYIPPSLRAKSGQIIIIEKDVDTPTIL